MTDEELKAFDAEVVRRCRTCRRDTTQQNMHDCLDAAHYVCAVCGGSEIVPEAPAKYGSE